MTLTTIKRNKLKATNKKSPTENQVFIVVTLTEVDALKFLAPINGLGGFQRLLRKLHSQFSNFQLFLTKKDITRIINYSRGVGGFQARLGPILAEIKSLKESLDSFNA